MNFKEMWGNTVRYIYHRAGLSAAPACLPDGFCSCSWSEFKSIGVGMNINGLINTQSFAQFSLKPQQTCTAVLVQVPLSISYFILPPVMKNNPRYLTSAAQQHLNPWPVPAFPSFSNWKLCPQTWKCWFFYPCPARKFSEEYSSMTNVGPHNLPKAEMETWAHHRTEQDPCHLRAAVQLPPGKKLEGQNDWTRSSLLYPEIDQVQRAFVMLWQKLWQKLD